MRFGPVPVAQARGAILAHSLHLPEGRLRKGQQLDKADVAALEAAGIETVTVAMLDEGDMHEDAAALALAGSLAEGAGLRLSTAFTGRVNLIAEGPGVVLVAADRINAVNAVDAMITVATVAPYHQIATGGMVATVKIISYAVPETAVAEAVKAAKGALRLAPPVHARTSLIVTMIEGGPGRKGLAAIRSRVEGLGMELAEVLEVPHEEAALAEALIAAQGEIVLVLTGSATSDINDTAPLALRQAGGRLVRFGMPVDPGNLLFLGELKGVPVIGLPGSARSPVLHGADWVLSRVACGLAVTGADMAAMGVGGLLKEIPTRPQPRRGRE